MTTNAQDMTEDQVLTYTRGKRMELADKLTVNGAPTDKEQATVLLQTLDGLDRSSLGRLKIRAEEKANQNNANSAAIIARVLSEIGSTKIYQHTTLIEREAPLLGDHIPVPEIVEGELETNPAQMDFDSFTKQFETPDSV